MVIKPILRPGNSKDEKRIAISIHNGGKNPTIKLIRGRKIKQSDWNINGNEDRKNWVRSSCPEFKTINEEILDYLTRIRAEISGIETPNLTNTQRGVNKPFLKLAEEYNNLVRNSATNTNTQQAIKKLESYLQEIDKLYLRFQDINKQFCKGYYNWLLDNHANSSANQYFGVFRTIYNEISDDESNNFKPTFNPFVGFKYQKSRHRSHPLTEDEFKKIQDFRPETRQQHLARNIWMVQFSQAMRIKEVLLMKWEDLRFNELTQTVTWGNFTHKTAYQFNRELEVPVLELLIPCMARYDKDIYEVMYNINHDLEEYKEVLAELKSTAPSKLSAEEILVKLQSGYSQKEIQNDLERIKEYQELIEEYETFIRELTESNKYILGKTIEDIKKDFGHEFVWDKPNEEGLDRDKIDHKDSHHFEAYKRCYSSVDGYLKRMAKKLNIKTTLKSHSARHTASNLMIGSGMDTNKVSKFLTHSNPRTTELYINRLNIKVDELSTFLSGNLNLKIDTWNQ